MINILRAFNLLSFFYNAPKEDRDCYVCSGLFLVKLCCGHHKSFFSINVKHKFKYRGLVVSFSTIYTAESWNLDIFGEIPLIRFFFF